jgi:hypothetical protein
MQRSPAEPYPEAISALTVDEMTQLAHARGALICFAHMSSKGGRGRCRGAVRRCMDYSRCCSAFIFTFLWE